MAKDLIPSTYPLTPPLTEEEWLTWLRLLRSRRVGISTFYRLLSEFGDAAAALDALPGIAHDAGLTEYRPANPDDIKREWANAQRLGAHPLAIGSPAYPARLAETPGELEAFLQVFADAGVDALHASQRRWWEAEFADVDGENGLNLAGWCKKLTGLTSITVGSVGLSSDFIGSFSGEDSKTRPISDVIERLDKGEFDMVAVGRALLQDPLWAEKIKEGRVNELADYDAKALATLY